MTTNKIALSKFITAIACLYLLYIAVTCPCDPLYKCHLSEMYMAVAVVVANLVFWNGLHLQGNYPD